MNLILTLISVLIKLCFIYFIVFALSGLTKPFEKLPEAVSLRRFAVLLPVRNEEKVIAKLIESLNEADYPKDKLEIWVVLNNSSDRSGEIAASLGARVMNVDVPVHSKGDALRYALDKLSAREDIDAYAVFDTDNVVDPGLFREMNKRLEAGKNIIQGRRIGKNAAENVLTGCYEIFYTMQNVYFNHARSSMGRSGSLNGTAWVVRKSWIDENGFDMKTMTEDLELTAIAALKGEHIGYAHEAVSYDEYPSRIRVSLRQLLRWSVGQVQCMKHYSAKLTKKFLKTGSLSSLNIDLVFLAPVLIVTFAVISLIFALVPAEPYRFPFVPPDEVLALAAATAFYALCYAARLKCGRDVKIPILSNAAFPFFLIMWLPLMVRSLFMKDIEWRPVVHDHAVSIDDIENKRKEAK